MDALRKDLETVGKRQRAAYEKNMEIVDSLLADLEKSRRIVEEGADDAAAQMEIGMSASLSMRVQQRKLKSVLEANQKELHAALHKFGKTLDKTMESSVERALRAVPLDSAILNRVVAAHLYRVRSDIAETFCREAHVELDATQWTPLRSLHPVLRALEQGDVEPALVWVRARRPDLERIGSNVELQLHSVRFMQLVRARQHADALQYARQHLQPLAHRFLPGVLELMGCLALAKRLRWPYPHLAQHTHLLGRAADRLVADACRLSGLAPESPLQVLADAGYAALPAMLRVAAVMERTEMLALTSPQQALPVEVELGPERQYHSVFVCPVSKELGSAENRPMALKCGHVIAEQSLAKLSRSAFHRFKCPYCPVEGTREQARPVQF